MRSFHIFANQIQRMTNFEKNSNNSNPTVFSSIELSFDQAIQTTTETGTFLKQDTIRRPTLQEIRYWKWQQDKKMFITDSHYLPSRNNTEIAYSEAIQHKGIDLPIREINRGSMDWLTLTLLVSLVIFASVRIGYAKYIGSLFQSVINYSTSFRMFGEKNNSILHGASRLEILYYLVFSLFLFQVLVLFSVKNGNTGLVLYAKTLGFVILYFVLKKSIYKFLGTIFNGVQETSEFIFNIDNFNRVAGIVLLPIVALMAYYPYEHLVFIVILGILTLVGLYIFLLQRGASILLKKQFSIFYLFLYLCTLEFLPLLLIYKIVVE